MGFTEIQTKRNSRTAACHSGARKKCADYSQISVMRMSFLRRLQLRLKCRRKDAVKIAIAPRDQANGQILLRGDRPCRFRAERIQPGGKSIGTHCRWRQHRQRGNVMPHRSAAARVNHMRLHRAVIINKKIAVIAGSGERQPVQRDHRHMLRALQRMLNADRHGCRCGLTPRPYNSPPISTKKSPMSAAAKTPATASTP